MNTKQITLGAQQGLNIVNAFLPLIEAAVPQVAAGDAVARLAVTGAQALIPLIEQIPTGELISVEEQAALKSRVDDIVSGKAFSGPEWGQSGPGPATPPVSAGEAAQQQSTDSEPSAPNDGTGSGSDT